MQRKEGDAWGVLKVRVEGAKDLIKRRLWGTRPYATVLFDGVRQSTAVERRNPNPKWRTPFQFTVRGDPLQLTLTVTVWDKGPLRFRDVVLGRAIVPLKMLLNQDEAAASSSSTSARFTKLDRWFELRQSESGSVHLVLELVDAEKDMSTEWVLLSEERESSESEVEGNEPQPEISITTVAVYKDGETPGEVPEPKPEVVKVKQPRTPQPNLAKQLLAEESTCLQCHGALETSDIVLFEDCFHYFCSTCVKQYAEEHIVQAKEHEPVCPFDGCSTPFPQYILRRALGPDAFESFIESMFREVLANSQDMIQCPNADCSAVMEKVTEAESSLSSLESLSSSLPSLPPGTHLSDEALQHLRTHRFRCRECLLEFCSVCMVTPYHVGFDCQKYKNYLMSRHCRFCRDPLPASTLSASGSLRSFDDESASSTASTSDAEALQDVASSSTRPLALLDICKSAECQAKKQHACTVTLECGHHCGGIAHDATTGVHLPCLHANCVEGNIQTADEFCNICWIDDLGSAPSIQLECGHVFHYQCVLDKLEQRWPSARITFAFWGCPLCKKRMQHPGIEEQLVPLREMVADIERRALKRLKYEGLHNADDITEKDGAFYQDPLGYAMSRFAYYMCNKCKKPYFGGQVSCNAAQEDGSAREEDLECGACSGIAVEECPRHGTEFIEHKCQYCCSVASWFCWGKVHFCDKCHTRQVKGDYVSRYPVSRLPKCLGPAHCPLKIDHPPNGTHFSLGCSLCKEAKEF